MNDRNVFFSEVFTRELNRWKKETNKTQEDFAAEVGIQPNMISRYKSGHDHPGEDTLTKICKVLSVDKTIFFPQTFEDHYRSSEEYRNRIHDILEREEAKELIKSGIDLFFWRFLWDSVPYMELIFPLNANDSNTLFAKRFNDKFLYLGSKDIEFFKKLQDDMVEFITMRVVSKALDARLSANTFKVQDFEKSLDQVLTIMVQELVIQKPKEATNGND